MRANKIDRDKLGHKLINVVLAAHQLDIEVKSTLTHNLPINSVEDEYIKDFVTMSTEEMIEKWFGGRDNVQSIISNKFGEALKK